MDLMQLLHTALHFHQNLGSLVAAHGTLVYAMLFAIVFVEIGVLPLFFLPGDPLLFLCGAFCVGGGMSIWVLMPVLILATIGGSVLSYATGRALGQRVFTYDFTWLDKAALARTHRFYENYGGVTFLLSPYLAVVRTFAPFVAGVSAMGFPRFVGFVVMGAVFWVVSMVVGGYFFGNVPLVRDNMSAIVLLGVGLGTGSLLLSGLWRWFKSPRRTTTRTQTQDNQ